MKRPWRRKDKPMQPNKDLDVPAIPSEAERARLHSERARDAALQQWEPVHTVSSSLRNHRRENHFAQLLGEIFRT